MKSKKMFQVLAMAVALIFIGAAGVMAQGTESEPVSDGVITPYIIAGENEGGNRTCAEVGTAFFGDANYYEFSSERVNYNDGDGFFDKPFPAGLTVSTDGTYVSWLSTFCIGAVIVKGSNDANVYVYDPQRYFDSGLASPFNASGKPAGLSNITFCWNPCEEECEWIGETAWAEGNRYVARGNWATYTPYDGKYSVVSLKAGQTMVAGTVQFSNPVDGIVTIIISLNPGWRFEDVEENVKIQDYATPPSGNPAPGLFAHKGNASGSSFRIDVPENNFYGVHVNVEWEYCE